MYVPNASDLLIFSLNTKRARAINRMDTIIPPITFTIRSPGKVTVEMSSLEVQ